MLQNEEFRRANSSVRVRRIHPFGWSLWSSSPVLPSQAGQKIGYHLASLGLSHFLPALCIRCQRGGGSSGDATTTKKSAKLDDLTVHGILHEQYRHRQRQLW